MIGLRRLRHAPVPVRRTDEGAVAVEFAFVVLPLLLLFFGIVGYGLQFSQQLSMSHAAREAARYATVAAYDNGSWAPRTCDQVAARAREAAASMAIPDTSKINVTVTRDGVTCASTSGACTGATSSSSVKVRLDYDSGLVLPFLPWNGKVGAEGVFRCEYS